MTNALRLIVSIAAVVLVAMLAHQRADSADGILAAGAAIGIGLRPRPFAET